VIAEAIKDYGVLLAGPMGTGAPEFKSPRIAFNGSVNCGHQENSSIVIPWPSEDATGVATEGEDAIAGQWFAGATLHTRVCNGDCSYETFAIDRVFQLEKWQEPDENGLYFDCCKTAFRPYDLAVTAVLLIARHHLGDAFQVSSDGSDRQWSDTKLLCYSRLGFGTEYRMDDHAGLVMSVAPEMQSLVD